MEQLEGFEIFNGSKLVCLLRKSLYGLKQAPRAWYTEIDLFLQSIGLIRSKEDYNLYYGTEANVILLLFVDDILIFAPNKRLANSIKLKLSEKYRMTDLRHARQFLGIQIERDRQKRTLRIH